LASGRRTASPEEESRRKGGNHRQKRGGGGRSDRASIGPLQRLPALRQSPLLLLREGSDPLPQRFHQGEALAAPHDAEGSCHVAPGGETDGAVEFRALRRHEARDRLQARYLGVLFPEELPKRREVVSGCALGHSVGREIPLLARQEVPALSRLGILQRRQQRLSPPDRDVGLLDERRRPTHRPLCTNYANGHRREEEERREQPHQEAAARHPDRHILHSLDLEWTTQRRKAGGRSTVSRYRPSSASCGSWRSRLLDERAGL
jgi:hypothetical protein